MQAPRMLPLLISVLAIPISFDMAIFAVPSGMLVIMVVVLAMVSALQAAVFAKAGTIATAVNMSAVIKILSMGTLPENKPAGRWPTLRIEPSPFPNKDN